MKWLWVQFIAMTILLAVGMGEYTASYFFDREGVVDNSLTASQLDQAVAGQPIDGLLCRQTDEVSTILYSDNLGPTDFWYGFAVEDATGTLCNGLVAEVSRGSSTVYAGPLLGLAVGGLDLPAAGNEELELTLRLAPGATEVGTCQFDTVWLAQQLESSEAPGFSDTESITHFVTGSGTGTGAGCVPPGDTVDLLLTKAISGVNLGYKLSDFSYRVTGNGLDVVVPHNQTVALPIGLYTIEELVPEGFVKEDWRIGWYGQCKRGSTFFTTIKINNGNIDHGILYCQADNQYRPAHGDNQHVSQSHTDESLATATSTSDTEVEPVTVEESTTISTETNTPDQVVETEASAGEEEAVLESETTSTNTRDERPIRETKESEPVTVTAPAETTEE